LITTQPLCGANLNFSPSSKGGVPETIGRILVVRNALVAASFTREQVMFSARASSNHHSGVSFQSFLLKEVRSWTLDVTPSSCIPVLPTHSEIQTYSKGDKDGGFSFVFALDWFCAEDRLLRASHAAENTCSLGLNILFVFDPDLCAPLADLP
jgi:hypothetical protein